MKRKTFIPDSYKMYYSFDEAKKTFVQFKLESAEKELLPTLIRVEKNNGYNSITGVNFLLRIRNGSNWTKCTITGLRPAQMPNFYYSDLPIQGVKSLCVIQYVSNTNTIEIRACKQFYPLNATVRTRLVNHLIKHF